MHVHDSDPTGNLPNRLEKASSDFTRQCMYSVVQTALEARTLSTGVYSNYVEFTRSWLARFAPPQLLWFRGLTTTRPTNKLKCHKLRPRDHMHRLRRNSNTASTRPKRTKTPSRRCISAPLRISGEVCFGGSSSGAAPAPMSRLR